MAVVSFKREETTAVTTPGEKKWDFYLYDTESENTLTHEVTNIFYFLTSAWSLLDSE